MSPLTQNQLSDNLQALPLLPASSLTEPRPILQHPAPMLVSKLVFDVLALAPARALEGVDEAATPQRKVVAVDAIAGAAAGGLEGAEGGVGVEESDDLLGRL